MLKVDEKWMKENKRKTKIAAAGLDDGWRLWKG